MDPTKTSLGSGRILEEGTMLAGRYRIGRLLGVGGMGMVYLAHDGQLDVDVALKVLRAEGAAADMRLARFRDELLLARQITHRNVVRIHDIGQENDLYFITMDFVDGQSLKHVLDLEAPLPAERATGIAADLADALAEAHRADIVHRDVKPANVLIGADRAYLTDFGVARSLHADGLTRTGEIIGTLDYLSPEQARGQPVDGRSDIYSLGLLLFEMLTGKRPFTGETADEVLAQRTLANPQELTARAKNVAPFLKGIVRRCLAVDPDERYQDAAELAEDLRRGSVSRDWRKPVRMAAIAVLAIAGTGMIAWLAKGYLDGMPQARDSSAIAVLPFDVAVSNADLASVSYGIAELLAEQMAASQGISIVANERVTDTLRDLKLGVDNLSLANQRLLGDLLDADYLVVGRLQQIDTAYQLEGRLRDVASGEVLQMASQVVDDAGKIFGSIRPLAQSLLESLDVEADPVDPMGAIDDPHALAAFASGVQLLSEGNAIGAIEPLQATVRDAPGFALGWDRLAQALARVGRDREALEAANAAVAALDGQDGRYGRLLRARRAALGGEPGESIALLEAMLEDSPGDNELRFMLAEAYGDAGRLQEASSTMKEVAEASPDHPQAWYQLGKFSILQGKLRPAVDEYLVKALVIQNRLNNDQGKADVLNALGIAHAELDDEAIAVDYYQQALELRRQIGDERGVAAVLANLSRISLRNGRYDEAREELIAAREQLQAIGDRWTVANLENELGFLEEQRGRFEAALTHYREALRLRTDLGDQRALAESYNNIGYTYYLLGEYDNALLFNDRALETYRRIDNVEGIMLADQTRGILETARGRYQAALKALLESLQISRDIGNAHAEAVTEGYIGNARYLQGQYSAADASFASATDKLDDLDDVRGLAEFILYQARLAVHTGDYTKARAAIDTAGPLLKEYDSAALRALFLRVDGTLLQATGDVSTAAQRYAAALREAKLTGEKVAVLLARLENAAGKATDARIAELQAIHSASERLGHGQLRFESATRLAREYFDTGRAEEALTVLRGLSRVDKSESEYHRDYFRYLLLADVLTALDEPEEAADAWRNASDSVQRMLAAQSDAQRGSFSTLPEVRRILEHEENTP